MFSFRPSSRTVRRTIAAFAAVAAAGAVFATAPAATAATGDLYTTTGPMTDAHDQHLLVPYKGYVDTLELTGGAVQVEAQPGFSGTQKVLLQYVVQKTTSTGWVNVVTGPPTSGTVSGSGTVDLQSSWSYSLAGQAGGFRISYKLSWQNAATNTTFATAMVTPTAAADTTCSASYLDCTAYVGRISTTGRPA